MALQRAARIGGDFLDLKELANAGPVLAVFRVREFLPAEPGDYGPNVPVIADVLVCSGPRAGEVHLGERFIGAVTGTLRGVKNPKKGEQPAPPETAVGDEIAARITVVERKGNAPFVGLDTPSDPEYAAIEQVHADGAAWNAAPQVPAQANGALAGSAGRPF